MSIIYLISTGPYIAIFLTDEELKSEINNKKAIFDSFTLMVSNIT